MKITVIGCSTSWTDRPTSSYCINGNILVDCGEGTSKGYKKNKINLMDIKNIFITHLHSDHTASLSNFLARYMCYAKQDKLKTLTIYGPIGLKEYLKHLLYISLIDKVDKNIEDYINLVEITDFTKAIKIDNINVTTYPFNHGNLQDIAYIFDDTKVKVGFSGDLNFQQGIDKFISNFDYGFLECCSIKSSFSHLGYDHYIEFQNKYRDKKLYAIHCVDEVYQNEKSLNITCAKHNTTYEF